MSNAAKSSAYLNVTFIRHSRPSAVGQDSEAIAGRFDEILFSHHVVYVVITPQPPFFLYLGGAKIMRKVPVSHVTFHPITTRRRFHRLPPPRSLRAGGR